MNLRPGGIIVPSYLVLFIQEPTRIAGTLIAAFLTMAVYRLSCRWLILFGRRRFVYLDPGRWVMGTGVSEGPPRRSEGPSP